MSAEAVVRHRLLVLVWAAAFVWWCLAGAALVYGHLDYDESAMWVRPLSWPWVAAAVVMVMIALRRPSQWAWTLIGLITAVHVGLVAWTW